MLQLVSPFPLPLSSQLSKSEKNSPYPFANDISPPLSPTSQDHSNSSSTFDTSIIDGQRTRQLMVMNNPQTTPSTRRKSVEERQNSIVAPILLATPSLYRNIIDLTIS